MKKKKHLGLVVLGLLIVLALFLPSQHEQSTALAAGSAVTLLDAQTSVGPGPASAFAQATPAEVGSEHYVFAYRAGGANAIRAACHLEVSLDSGTSWNVVHTFSAPDDTFIFPTCGTCVFRAYVDSASATSTSTVTAVLSGAAVATAPTYTQTPTKTPTSTPTLTPTHG